MKSASFEVQRSGSSEWAKSHQQTTPAVGHRTVKVGDRRRLLARLAALADIATLRALVRAGIVVFPGLRKSSTAMHRSVRLLTWGPPIFFKAARCAGMARSPTRRRELWWQEFAQSCMSESTTHRSKPCATSFVSSGFSTKKIPVGEFPIHIE